MAVAFVTSHHEEALVLGNNKDIATLNDLIATTIDSADGFERSVQNVDDPQFRQMFETFARERREATAQLQQQVRALGGTPEDDGTVTAAVHRRWEDLRSALQGDNDKAVIEEVECGEDHIKSKYEAALEDGKLSSDTAAVVRACFESVRRGHDRVSQLKHSLQRSALH